MYQNHLKQFHYDFCNDLGSKLMYFMVAIRV